MKKTSFYIFYMALAMPSDAALMVNCAQKNGMAPAPKTVMLELNAKKFPEGTLHCIHGADLGDMTACAPSGGFGLSAPTGSGALVDVVGSEEEFEKHMGGVTHAVISNTGIYFGGGYFYAGEWSKRWEFRTNRLTGKGEWASDKNSPGEMKTYGHYVCKIADQKF